MIFFYILQHVEVAIPSPRKDEVLIKIEAVSLNPVDWQARKLRTLLRPILATNSAASIPCKLIPFVLIAISR